MCQVRKIYSPKNKRNKLNLIFGFPQIPIGQQKIFLILGLGFLNYFIYNQLTTNIQKRISPYAKNIKHCKLSKERHSQMRLVQPR